MSALRQAVVRAGNQPSDSVLAEFERRYPNSEVAALARLRRGYDSYQARNYATAVALLDTPVIADWSRLGDYGLYYLGKAQFDSGKFEAAQNTLTRLTVRYPQSPLVREATLQAARAAAVRRDVAAVERVLKPLLDAGDGNALAILTLTYHDAGRLDDARRIWRRIITEAPDSLSQDEVQNARQALFPNPVAAAMAARVTDAPGLRLRAYRLYEAKQYAAAVDDFTQLATLDPAALQNDEARFRYGVSLYFAQKFAAAAVQLAAVSDQNKERHAEALFYLAEAVRRSGGANYPATVERLLALYPTSPRAGEALENLARWAEKHGDASYYDRLVRQYPERKAGQQWHFKRAWALHQQGAYAVAVPLLLEHVALFPFSDNKGRAAYWAARDLERVGRSSEARLLYEAIVRRYRYNHYGQQAAERLQRLRAVPAAQLTAEHPVMRAVAGLPPARPSVETIGSEGVVWLERASQLRIIGLMELSLNELEAARRTAPTSPKVALEIARVYRDLGQPHQAAQALQRAHPDYAAYQGDEISREEWEILYPLREWETIQREAKAHGLDPFIVAGLIRQESIFDPNARSPANAIGLMQLLPSTGRLVANKKGVGPITTEQLYNPQLNIVLGVSYLAEMRRRFGRYEYAFAAYNAGPGRVINWLKTLPTEELDVWIDAIPITETRLYVLGVIRNAAHYRRLYGSNGRD
ncbi:MAG: transglycosylase SLT domain-containing protein [Chloracidobacterium sp.]|nr:transglycosylase SLT domain-containing protein [Chloracidobacterium sp.]MDW8216593.1 transglycosylase SLT domain-containing protein [Acidobacteriota bacterium]